MLYRGVTDCHTGIQSGNWVRTGWGLRRWCELWTGGPRSGLDGWMGVAADRSGRSTGDCCTGVCGIDGAVEDSSAGGCRVDWRADDCWVSRGSGCCWRSNGACGPWLGGGAVSSVGSSTDMDWAGF